MINETNHYRPYAYQNKWYITIFSGKYMHIYQYIRLYINKHVCIYIALNIPSVLLQNTYTLQLTLDNCLYKIWLIVALMLFNL